MEPSENNKSQMDLNKALEIKESEWCEYSGMPSPLFYEKEEQKPIKKNAEENSPANGYETEN
jgi:hypothetical protein